MKKSFLFPILVAVGVIVFGCNHTGSNNAKETSKVLAPPTFGYFLPRVALDVSLGYEITQCDEKNAKFNIIGDIKPVYSADKAQFIELNTEKIKNFLQKSDLTLKWNEDGTLKSVNSVAEDRTPAVISKIFTTAVATVGAIALFDTGIKEKEVKPCICKDEVKAWLDEIARLREGISNARKKVQEVEIGDSKFDEDYFRAVDRKISAMHGEIARLQKELTHVEKTTIDPNEEINLVSHLDLSEKKLEEKWFKPLETEGFNDIIEELRVNIEWELYSKVGVDKKPMTSGDSLVFRYPRQGLLSLYGKNFKKTVDISVPQLGGFYKIPLDADWFENRTILFDFGRAGNVTKVQYISNAKAEAAASAAGTFVSGVGKLRTAIKYGEDDAEIQELTKKKEMLELERDIKCLEMGRAPGCDLE